MTEIPAASTFLRPRKVGYLKKLTGKGWIYSGCWKRRYCVLDETKLYFYEGETSQGNEKTAGVISLDYYDLCEEGSPKDSKRVANVFFVGTSVRGFFDNRHLFSAESKEERDGWINAIRDAVDEARSNRCRAGRSKINGKREKRPNSSNDKEEPANENRLEKESIEIPLSARLVTVTKDRVKGPVGRRLPQRKSMMPPEKKHEFNENEKQRSASLSGLCEILEDGESDNRKSQSMEAVVDGKVANESVCSSNTEDSGSDHEASFLSQKSSILSGHSPRALRESLGPDQCAFLRELENKVGAPQRQSKRYVSSNVDEQDSSTMLSVKSSVEVVRSRMAVLGNQIERVEKDVMAMRKDISKVQEQMTTSSANDDKIIEEASLMEERMNSILKEVNAMFEKAQEALEEAQKTKNECYCMKEEFREMLSALKSNERIPVNSSALNIIDEI